MEKTYLLTVTIGGKPTRHRIAEAASGVKSVLKTLSPDHKLVYTSGDGTAFGFLLKSELRAHQIGWHIYSPGTEGGRVIPCPLQNDDQFLILELGTECSGVAPSTVGSWLRFHRPSRSPAASHEVGAAESKGQSQLASQLAAIKGKIGKG
jgi:hypothetical protein